jgi:hypothetical protein
MQKRILIVLRSAGPAGLSLTLESTDGRGTLIPLDTDGLAALAPEINVAALAEIERLKAAHAEELADLRAQFDANSQAPAPDTSPRALARAALREKWDSLPAWIRGPYQHQFAAANALLDAGQDDAAAALIQYADVPTAFDLEQIEVFSRVRDEMLAALEALPA